MKGKKVILVVGIVLLVIIAVAVGLFIYKQSIVTPEKAFEKFQKNSIIQATSYEKESVYPANDTTTADMQGSLDLNAKSLEAYGELACKVNSSAGNFSITFGLYGKNATSNLSFLSASGTLKSSGQEIQLADALSPVIGKWFKVPDEDKAQAEQLENQVSFNSINVYAPKANQQAVYDSLVKNNVFKISNQKKSKLGNTNVYIYTVTISKSDYLKFLNEAFPNLKQKDLIIDGLFDDNKDSKETELTIDAKTFNEVSTSSRGENYCSTYIENFLGVEDTTLPAEIGYKAEQVNKSDIKITAPTNVLPIEQLSELLQQ